MSVRFQDELSKRYDMNLDSLLYFGNAAKQAALEARYEKGLIQVYLGLGSGYIDKNKVESAKNTFSLAIEKATAIKDTQLLAKAYAGYGWALIYDNSDYEGSTKNLSIACELARESKDSSLLNTMSTKLARVFFLKGDFLKAYETTTDLIAICKARKDTFSLIYNYYLFGSIFSDMGLFDKQMDMVYQALTCISHVKDSLTIYTINNAASNGYLNTRQYDSVLYYSRLNLPLAKKLNKYPYCYTNIAMAYIESNQLDSAKYYYEKILSEQKARSMYIDRYVYLQLGKIEDRLGNSITALAYFKQVESEIRRPSLKTQKELYHELHLAYKEMGNFQTALDYLEKYNVISDSILNNRHAITLGDYKAAMLEVQVKLLTKDKELQSTLLAKKAQQQQVVYASISIMAILAGLAFVRFRKQKNLKAKQELATERLRISRELHDEIGSTLSGIAMYGHVVKEQVRNNENVLAENSLTFMQKSAGEMVSKLSDIVWLIHPDQDTISELFGRLSEYAKQMASAKNMHVKIDIPPSLSEMHIPIEARRNIYLFCKEAINNAVKYSDGSFIGLQAKISGDQIRFSVRDNGKGFDEISVKRGNGLENMKRRAEAIGATFKIGSRPQQGVNIEMQYKVIQ